MSAVQANPGAMRHLASTLDQESAALTQVHRSSMPLAFTTVDVGQDYVDLGKTAVTAVNDLFHAVKAMADEAQGLATNVRAASGEYVTSDESARSGLNQAGR